MALLRKLRGDVDVEARIAPFVIVGMCGRQGAAYPVARRSLWALPTLS
jgi:hypothetical protein